MTNWTDVPEGKSPQNKSVSRFQRKQLRRSRLPTWGQLLYQNTVFTPWRAQVDKKVTWAYQESCSGRSGADSGSLLRTRDSAHQPLLQLFVFGFGFFQDGDVGIGVFPQGEEVLIGSFRFGGVSLKRIGAAHA